MGYFYFDETIQVKADFIVGAWVYSPSDVDSAVMSALEEVALVPGKDEFKSGLRMDRSPKQVLLREELYRLLQAVQVGVVVVPTADRPHLGDDAFEGLRKILTANGLGGIGHQVFVDEGVRFNDKDKSIAGIGDDCQIHLEQDSRVIGGLQLADLAAHTMGVMLLDALGLVSKTVKVPIGGDETELGDISLGFEMWATLRYQFFTQDRPRLDVPQHEGFTLETGRYALHLSSSLPDATRAAAEKRFGQTYVGCIH